MLKNKKYLAGILGALFVFATIAFAASETKLREDILRLGRNASSANKTIIFEEDAGASNPQIVSDHSALSLWLKTAVVKIGRAAGANISLVFDKGGSNAEIRWNNSTSKLEFSHDGSTYKAIGSGSGGGGGVVLNENYGFEDDLTGWAETGGGTLALVTTAANVGFGEKAASFDASADTDYLQGQTVTVPSGLAGKVCTLSWYYKGGDSNLKVQVYDVTNTAVWAESSALTAQSSYSAKQVLYFTCPDQGVEIAPRIYASGDAAVAYFDDVKLGQELVVGGSTASLVASGYFASSANCAFTFVTSALTAASTDSDCPGPTVEVQGAGPGILLTTDADLPKFTINNLPPGSYRVTFSAIIEQSNSSGNVLLAISDGTNVRGLAGGNPTTNTVESITVSGNFVYTTTGNRTFELFGSASLGTVTARNSSGNYTSFDIVRTGGTGEEQTVSVDKMGWRIAASISGAVIDLGTSAVGTRTAMSNSSLSITAGTGSAPVEIACSDTNPSSGSTCSAGNEQNSIAFTPPTAGVYEACSRFNWLGESTGSIRPVFSMVETPNNAQTVLQSGLSYVHAGAGNHSGGTYIPIVVCDDFTFSDTSKRTLRVMYTQTVSSASASQIFADGTAGRQITWTVRRKVEFQDAVKFTNLVTTPAQSGSKLMSAKIDNGSGASCSSGSCTISNSTGTWISAASRTNVGEITVTFVPGIFSAEPNCWASTTVDADNCYSFEYSGTSSLIVNGHSCNMGDHSDSRLAFKLFCNR